MAYGFLPRLWYVASMLEFLDGRLPGVRMCLIVSATVLVVIGIATIYAVGQAAQISGLKTQEDLPVLYKRQIVFAVLGIIAFIAVNKINYRRLGPLSYWFYGLTVLLLAVLVVSRIIRSRFGVDIPFAPFRNGSHRWIMPGLGVLPLPGIQPSEFAKLAFVLSLAWYLRYRSNYRHFKTLIGPFALTLVPAVLILAEPDLGIVLLLMPVLFTMLFVAGAKGKHLLLVVGMAALISPALWFKMEYYQRMRVSGVLLQSDWVRQKARESPALSRVLVGRPFDEKRWMRDSGFQLNRSKLAIASGAAFGQGFLGGPFIKYGFLPYRYNDFIFSTIAHQWGFVGAIAVLGLYGLIVLCGLEIASHNIDPFGRLLALGILCMFTYEALENVSMTMGLMPITGLTLPLVSYGGSSLLVNMTALGLLNNVGRCRPFTLAKRT